jgi:hypothetical protein
MADILRVGDYICLRDIKAKQSLCAEGILSDELMVGKLLSFDDDWFQVCLQRQYSAFVELEEFNLLQSQEEEMEEEENGNPNGKLEIEIALSKQNHLKALRRGLVNEEKMNNLYMKNKFGEPIHYGDSIQLLHVKSKKYVTIVENEVSPSERQNIRVLLHPRGTSASWLVIQPRFRINKLGDVVITNSEIKLNVAERMNEYLHTSEAATPSSSLREVNSSLEPTSWVLNIFQSSFNSKDDKIVLTSQLVYLYDPETLSNLSIFKRPAIIQEHGDDVSVVSDDDSIMAVSAEGEVVMEPMDNVVNTNALWVLENKQMLTGGPIQLKSSEYRLKHVNTGKYICMNSGGEGGADELSLSVTSRVSDKGNLFSIQELHSQSSFLQDKKAVHISHNGAYLERGDLREIANISHYCCKGSRNKSNAVYLFISVYKEAQGFEDDLAKRQLLQSQPLDVYVGASIKNTLTYFLNALPDFSDFSLNDTKDYRFQDRIWADLEEEEDEQFYVVVERTIKYLRGQPISIRISPLDDQSVDCDDEINEFGEIVRDDLLIATRQNMCCDQGLLEIILILLNQLLPLYIGINADNVNDDDDDDDASANSNVIDEGDEDMDEDEMDDAVGVGLEMNKIPTEQDLQHESELDVRRKSLLFMGTEVAKCLLRLLFQLVKRNNTNQLHVANHLHVILGWVSFQPIAASVVKEMLSDNFELQIKYISETEIEVFTAQIGEPDAAMKSMYLSMLQAFCSCSDKGISKNQKIVLDLLRPMFEDILFKLRIQNDSSGASESNIFNSTLYLPQPEDKQSLGRILGGDMLTHGTPKLFLSWESPIPLFAVTTLFRKREILVSELCRPKIKEKVKPRSTLITKSFVEDQKSKMQAVRQTMNRSASFMASRKYSFGGGLSKNMAEEKKDMVCEYFISQLHLAADLCLDRNYIAIDALEKKFPYEILVTILSGSGFSVVSMGTDAAFKLQGACARLLCSMYVDRQSETTSRMPILSRMWTTVKDGEIELASVGHERVFRFALLQQIISDFMHNIIKNGCKYQVHMLHVINILKKLIELNFYGDVAKLKDIIEPILVILNRRVLDTLIDEDRKKKKELVLEKVVPWQKTTLSYLDTIQHLISILTVVFIATTVTIVQISLGVEHIALDIFEYLVFFIFAGEVSLRGYCHYFLRRNLNRFIGDIFVRLDLALVLLDMIVMATASSFGALGSFTKVLRALRILRVARILKAARLLNSAKKTEDKEKWVLPQRYRTAPAHELQTMRALVDSLYLVQQLIHDRNISLFLKGLSKWEFDENEVVTSGIGGVFHSDHPDTIFERMCGKCSDLKISDAEHDDTLLDLVMYVNPPLVQSVLELLLSHHSTYAILMDNADKVQILASPRREKQFAMIQNILLQIDRNIETFALWGEVNSPEAKEKSSKTISMIYTLRDNCRMERKILEFDHDHEADKEVQIILRNFGWWDIAVKLLKRLDSSGEKNVMTEAGRSTKAIMKACNDMLYWYALSNDTNQNDLFAEVDFFLNTVDDNIGSHYVISAIFMDNENLMTKVDRHYIGDFADRIVKMGRFPQYLTLMRAVTAVGEKNIIENQYEIVKQIASPFRQKKILAFCSSTSNFEYSKKLKLMQPYLNKKDVSSHEIAAELAYHLELLSVLSGCTVGVYNITTIETKVQAMFNYVDLVEAILDPACLLLIKIRSGLFLYNSYLEVEMRLPGLVFAPIIWKLLQSCVDVFSSAKDELRKVERNGWVSNRQQIEYIVVCAMIVKGFFGEYYDPATFEQEQELNMKQSSSALRPILPNVKQIIDQLFTLLKGLYELDSPVLSKEHKSYFFVSLEALSKAKGIVMTQYVDVIDSKESNIQKMLNEREETDRLEHRMFRMKRSFVSELKASDKVRDILKDEFHEIIKKIQSLPLVSDQTSTSTIRYEVLLKKFVDHIKGGIQIDARSSGQEKILSPEWTKTSIWVIKMFRTMIESAWGMTIYERDDDGGEEQDVASAFVTDTLNKCGATALCLDLISNGIDQGLILEAIKLLVAMLFKEGGAEEVQKTIYTHLKSTDSDYFFRQLRSVFNRLISWHEWKGADSVDEHGNEVELPEEIISIRFIQLMCEGHYTPNQDILREQSGKFTSVNLLDDMVSYMISLGKISCPSSTKAALAVGGCILEVIQGPCEGNQDHFALHTSLMEALNNQMRSRAEFENCDKGSEVELKKTVVDIFQGLLEGQGRRVAVYERVLSVIHLDIIQLMCNIDCEDSKAVEVDEDEDIRELETDLQTESLVLLQMLCDFRPSLQDELEVIRIAKGSSGTKSSITIGEANVASVEIMWRGELQRRFFNIPSICGEFSGDQRSKFMDTVERSSHEKKILDMYKKTKEIYIELLHGEMLTGIQLNKLFNRKNQNIATWITFSLCCAINIMFVVYYDGTECFAEFRAGNQEADDVICDAPALPTTAREVVNVLNIFQITFSSFTLLMFLIVKTPVLYIKYMQDGRGFAMSIMYTAVDPMTLYYFFYVVMAAISYKVDHVVTLLLMDIVVKNSYAMDVLYAVIYPFKALSVSLGLMIIIMYIFSVVLFLYIDHEDALAYADDCYSLWSCFKFSVGYGRSGDFNEEMLQKLDFNQWVFGFLFDIAIHFVLLNVIRGITVDTFSELRVAKLARLRDTRETCFICSIEKQVFDRDKISKGFDAHITSEHHVWNYIFFIIYIWQQDKDDDDGLEQFVRRSIEANDIGWLPMNKSMILTKTEENESVVIKKTFQKEIHDLELNFLNSLDGMQTGVSNIIDQVKRSVTKRVDGGESFIDTVHSGSVSNYYMKGGEGGFRDGDNKAGEKMNRHTSMKELKAYTGAPISSNDNSYQVMVEICEIKGLAFPTRLLESLSCRIRTDSGMRTVLPSHVLTGERGGDVVVFESVQCIIYDSKNDFNPEELTLFQITRSLSSVDAPKFVGFFRLQLKEILDAIDQKVTVQQPFEANILGNICQGTLLMNVSHNKPELSTKKSSANLGSLDTKPELTPKKSNLGLLLSPDAKLDMSPNKKMLPPLL